jgi:hypothetical protein
VYTGITAAGREFQDIASRILGELNDFRTEEAKRAEILREMTQIIDKMKHDQSVNGHLPVVKIHVEMPSGFQDLFDRIPPSAPAESLEIFHQRMRLDFSKYEERLTKEMRVDRNRGNGISASEIDM